MINLLPGDAKQNFAYARQSTKLLKWSFVFVLSIAGVWLIVAFGLFYINSSINKLTAQNAQTQQSLKDQKIDETKQQVKEMSASLKLVVQVLSREILFSKLIQQIGSAIPSNAVLTDLQIAKTEGAIDLIAVATDYNTASQVQVNLQDPANKIFDKADIINITCNTSSSSDNSRYPCTVNIRAQFAKSNPFLFINNGTSP